MSSVERRDLNGDLEGFTQRSAHASVKAVADEIRAWADTWNENPTPFVWHKSAEQILERLANYCTAINAGTTT